MKTTEQIDGCDLADCCPDDLEERNDSPRTFDHDAGLPTESRLADSARSDGATETPPRVPAQNGRPQLEAAP
jgi:hypothetical protein